MYEEDAYFVDASSTYERFGLAAWLYDRVFRTTLNEPGFALVDWGPDITSTTLRRRMVELSEALRDLHYERIGAELIHTAASRFDQQVTTKPHRDGAPHETVLMLGYEPTVVGSVVAMADHTKASYDLGISPTQFLRDFNPMYSKGEASLAPYVTELTPFQPRHAQLVLINNSNAAYEASGVSLLGVLHTARIDQPRSDHQRVVNSMMMASVPAGTQSPITAADVDDFLTSDLVRKYVP